MKRKIKIVLVAVLSATLLLSLTACSAVSEFRDALRDALEEYQTAQGLEDETSFNFDSILDDETTESESISPLVPETTLSTETTVPATTEPAGQGNTAAASIPEYYHYELDSFYALCDKIVEAAKSGKSDDVISLYDQAYAECMLIRDLSISAYLNFAENTSDEYYKEETTYADSIATKAADYLMTSGVKVTETSCADAFAKHLGNDEYYENFKEYEPLTDEELKLSEREQELESEYESKVAKAMTDYSYKEGGKEYNLEYLTSEEAYELMFSDSELFYKAYEECLRLFAEDVSPIYLELVSIRDRLAKLEGYDNFNDYADEELYERDYKISDLENLRKEAREIGPVINNYSFDSLLGADEENLSVNDILGNSNSIFASISDVASTAFEHMTQNNLYSIDNGENRLEGSFTVDFVAEPSEFLFINRDASTSTYSTLAHELGHFAAAYYVPNPEPLFLNGCLDCCEIQSTGLEILFNEKADLIYGSTASYAKAQSIKSTLTSIVEGCLFDEWQREIYENPDMTIDEMNKLFVQIFEEYYGYTYDGCEYMWAFIPHNFTSPDYYISYATSAFAALQIWDMATTDYDKAVDTWEAIVKYDIYDNGYEQLIKDLNLTYFGDASATSKIFYKAVNYLDEINASNPYSNLW